MLLKQLLRQAPLLYPPSLITGVIARAPAAHSADFGTNLAT